MKPIVFSLVLLLIGCFHQNPNTPCEAALNQEFDIKVGEERLIERVSLKLAFISVLEDSRCPQGVQCIQAGNGKIEILIKLAKEETRLELNTATGPQQATVGSYEVRLVNLEPYPKRDGQIQASDYVARVIVSKKSS